MQLDDTIAAIATAPGGAARGIVRLSGPGVAACLAQACSAESQADLASAASPRVFSTGIALANVSATPLPCDIYYWPHTRSYTRQPVAELHTIGSPPLLAALLRRMCEAGARPAAPGEFTLRAFLAGRIDLTQAEAVLGVIDARSENELNTALTQLAGGLAAPLHQLRSDLLDLLAHLEAGLDFVEEDIEFISAAELDATLAQAESQVAKLADQMTTRANVQDAVRIVLAGRPNAGKSSLFNALLAELPPPQTNEHSSSPTSHAPAIVSSEAGTTRDYLSAQFELAGVPVKLIDTAGIDSAIAHDGISQAAQQHANVQHATAQVRVICLDASSQLSGWDEAQIESYVATQHNEQESQTLLVRTKCDAIAQTSKAGLRQLPGELRTSSLTGAGIAALFDRLASLVVTQSGGAAHPVATTVVRCRDSLRQAATALASARTLAQSRAGEELVAWEVRSALDGLGNVVGAIYTDDVLDRVFSRFCIGK
jgi:tRNA modification GTPase